MFSSFENRAVISWDIVTKSDLHIEVTIIWAG
jgi:hypothetical protein